MRDLRPSDHLVLYVLYNHGALDATEILYYLPEYGANAIYKSLAYLRKRDLATTTKPERSWRNKHVITKEGSRLIHEPYEFFSEP